MKSKKQTIKYRFRILAAALIVAISGSLVSCKKAVKVPTKEEFLQNSLADPDRQGIRQYDFSKTDLIKAWGEPDLPDSGYGKTDAWVCGNKFILAEYDPDDPNKIESLYASFTQDLVILFPFTSIVYAVTRKDGVTDYNSCLMLSEDWFAPGTLEGLGDATGTILQMEFDGFFMESFPMQIGKPFSLKVIGQIPDSEREAAEEQAEYIRSRYTEG